MSAILVNVDVDDLEKGTRFYCEGLGLRVGRRFDGWVELLGADAPLYLLPKAGGTEAFPRGEKRRYVRHWTPVHLDFVVRELGSSVARARAGGAHAESEVREFAGGRYVVLSDPFGNGFCLIELAGQGYAEVA